MLDQCTKIRFPTPIILFAPAILSDNINLTNISALHTILVTKIHDNFKMNLFLDLKFVDVPRGPPITVTLKKEGAGLGFSLEGGKDSPYGDRPMTIKKIFTGE